MYKEPLFMQPVFQERIWGGKKLKTEFNYEIPSDTTGEAWIISAHPNGPSEIKNGPLKGKTLIDAWKQHGELFNKQGDEEFPLLVKILDANNDLSVQVHPDDTYAQQVEGQPYGKTECWYVLSAEEGAEIIFGHHASSQKEFEQMANSGEWEQLLRRVKVKAGDFVYVPSGTVHAIGKGIVILETQQSSDITYRVYDYDRTDAQGNTRELHLDQAIEVTTAPHQTVETERVEEKNSGLTSTRLVSETYFTVYHWKLDGSVDQQLTSDFLQVSVVEGSAKIEVGNNYESTIEKGDHFIIPSSLTHYTLTGNAEFIVSHP